MADEPDLRDTRVVIYMTREDADALTRFSKRLRFRSRSTFVVAILERLIMGGFSIASFFKVGCQVEKRADRIEDSQFEFNFDAVKTAVRPFPALPPEDDPEPKEVRAVLKEIREELTPT